MFRIFSNSLEMTLPSWPCRTRHILDPRTIAFSAPAVFTLLLASNRKMPLYEISHQDSLTNFFKEVEDDHTANEITRSMVQKSVVVLSSRPVYGAIHFTLDPVTMAYFNQGISGFFFYSLPGRFDERTVLIETYTQLCNRFKPTTILDNDTMFLGTPTIHVSCLLIPF